MSVSHQPLATDATHNRAGIRHIHRFLLPLAQRRTYVETADLLLDLLFGVTWFSIFTTLIATGASLLITIVGLPILTATLYLARTGAALERRRARIFLNAAIPEPVYDPDLGTVFQRLLAPFRDATTRNHLAYMWLVQPAQGIINFTVTVTVWAAPLWALTLPVYATHTAPETWTGERINTWHEIIPIAVGGLILLPLAAWVIRGLAAADRTSAIWGLGQAASEPVDNRRADFPATVRRAADRIQRHTIASPRNGAVRRGREAAARPPGRCDRGSWEHTGMACSLSRALIGCRSAHRI